MYADELFKILEAMDEDERRKTKLMITFQPNWPLQAPVFDVISSMDLVREQLSEEQREEVQNSNPDMMAMEQWYDEKMAEAEQDMRLFIVGGDGGEYAPSGIYNRER